LSLYRQYEEKQWLKKEQTIPFSSNPNKIIKIVKYMLVGKDKKRSDTSEEQAGNVKILKISPAKMKPDANKRNFLFYPHPNPPSSRGKAG
jgi:hypothetical protein